LTDFLAAKLLILRLGKLIRTLGVERILPPLFEVKHDRGSCRPPDGAKPGAAAVGWNPDPYREALSFEIGFLCQCGPCISGRSEK